MVAKSGCVRGVSLYAGTLDAHDRKKKCNRRRHNLLPLVVDNAAGSQVISTMSALLGVDYCGRFLRSVGVFSTNPRWRPRGALVCSWRNVDFGRWQSCSITTTDRG